MSASFSSIIFFKGGMLLGAKMLSESKLKIKSFRAASMPTFLEAGQPLLFSFVRSLRLGMSFLQ